MEVREVRIILGGKGRSGKTSLLRALQGSSGRTELIDEEDRTVGVDVVRGWHPCSGDVKVSLLRENGLACFMFASKNIAVNL